MTTSASAASNMAAAGICIRVTGPNGFCSEHEVPPGDALVVGTSPACGVRIEGEGIAPMHCTLSFEEGLVVIDDWDTGAGTYLDGQRIARQAAAEPGANIQIGQYHFTTAVAAEESSMLSDDDAAEDDSEEPSGYVHKDTDPFLPAFETRPNNNPPRDAWDQSTTQVENPPADAGDLDGGDPADSAVSADDASAYDASAYDSSSHDSSSYDSPGGDSADGDFVGGDLVGRNSAGYESAGYESAVSESGGYESGGYDSDGPVGADDMTELLKIELDYLRTELAERDARVAELEQSLDGGGAARDEDLPTREEVDALASRLEELLEELDHSDERLKTMSELLRVSEEANVAAVEERTQMESWMGEVERRVRDWEGEWHAERDTLNRRIAELTAQRDEAEARGGSRENTKLIQDLRQQISQLESDSARMQEEYNQMQQRMQAADVASIEEQISKAVDEAMREERLQLSQERAEMARERATLMRQQEELATQPSTRGVTADVADLKIRAFREHLKEIRATEPNHRPAPSMSQRLGKLWRKIDGRPLDTD